MTRGFTVVIEKTPDGSYLATVPELPGCVSTANNLDDLRANVRDDIVAFLAELEPTEPLPDIVGIERVEV